LEFKSFFESQIESLKISNGKEAVDLLINSERVNADIKIAFELFEGTQSWNLQLAVRKWIEHNISMEFRGFVFQRQLTALSQYFDMLYLPEVVSQKSKLLKLIQKKFDEISNVIPYDNCVVDFVVIGDEEHPSVLVIEFNPWNRFTSASLFDWKKDIDTLEGRNIFQFRTLDKPLEVLRSRKEESKFEFENISSDLLEEYSDLLGIVKSHLESNVDRINSNLRYTLNKRCKNL